MPGRLNQKETSSCDLGSAGFPPGEEVYSKKRLIEILFDINSEFASMGAHANRHCRPKQARGIKRIVDQGDCPILGQAKIAGKISEVFREILKLSQIELLTGEKIVYL